jgi:hypothetical protein
MESKKNIKKSKEDKEPSTNKNNYFQLHKIRERLKNKPVRTNYFAPTGTELLAILIQKQNETLLNKLAEYKGLSTEDTQKLFREFHTPGYWITKPTVDINKEGK